MAHFAELIDGVVQRVIVVNNADCNGGGFPDSEPVGRAFISEIGISGDWWQTSYNGNFRGIWGAVGCTYDPVLDVFVAPAVEVSEP